MEGKLIHDFVDTLAWPVIIIAAFFFFRREVKGLIERLSKLSFGDVSLELMGKVESLEDRARGTDVGFTANTGLNSSHSGTSANSQ